MLKELIINTHKILSTIIYDKVQENSNFKLLEYNYFIWGNIQPDIVPSLLLKSHYKDESLNFVIDEIVALGKTSPSVFYNKQTCNKFSKDIGIVCHFLCDFFCFPHYNRWHYNSSMILSHIKYENKLSHSARNILTIPTLSLQPVSYLENDTLKSFIEAVLWEYSLNEDYRNDLIFASNICAKTIETIVYFIFDTMKPNLLSEMNVCHRDPPSPFNFS